MEMPTITVELYQVPLIDALVRFEKEIYKHAIEYAKYNQVRAARLLGVSRGTLRKKLAEFYPGVYY